MSQDNGAHIEDGATTDASLASRAKNPKKNGPKWWLISLIAVIVAVAVVIGVTLAFGGKKDDKSASSSNQYADTVTIGLKLAPTNLDIRNTAGSALDQILIGNVYEGIVARDSKNQVAPAIASSWETSKDGLTYTFHLNKNMTFSNGDKLDAEDVAWSINELIAKGYHDADALAAVSKVEAKDADTAVITLKTPNSNLLWRRERVLSTFFCRKCNFSRGFVRNFHMFPDKAASSAPHFSSRILFSSRMKLSMSLNWR